ncbi:c-type cytochrome [Pseudoduganella rivuli]|uniref:c-type cytochrome n=1 Tax=Pseudoduganella rivuli TaxID=2666085 RepID=UPI0035313B10
MLSATQAAAQAGAPKAAARPAVVLPGNAEAGRVKAEAERCLECHVQPGIAQGHSAGEDGKFARLGGQQHAYIVKQVQDFRAGRRKNDFMAMMANSVSDEDVADIAAYFAAQPAMPAAAKEGGKGGATPGVAAVLFRQGDAARKVAACAACHGAGGEGIAGVAPVIGGQGRRYLSQQLHNWRSGERSNAPGPGMREAAAGLTDSEIEALALYVSEM